MKPTLTKALAATIVFALLAGCAGRTPSSSTTVSTSSAAVSATANRGGETPIPAESNPPGDIPDTQAFINYVSSEGHYSISAPEGWARTEADGVVTFTDKFNGITVMPVQCALFARPSGIRDEIRRTTTAVRDLKISSAILPAGKAQYAAFSENSRPEPVTGKRVRLGENVYVISARARPPQGRCAVLKLWAPLGADNVDQWLRIARSFRWR